MRNTVAIMQRELSSLFYSPIAYIVLAGFLLITGLLVWVTDSFSPGRPATLRAMFFWTPFVLTIILPAISMRAVAEEYRTGTIETLMTAPVTDAQLVLGKFFASFIFYVLMLAATFVYVILLAAFGAEDWGASISSYIGLLLVGTTFLAFGIFASSLTRNQVVAWIVGAVPLLLFAFFAYFFVSKVEGFWRSVCQQVNVMGRFETFGRGLVTSDNVVFFVAVSALWLFLAIKVVESKRWR